MIYIDVSLGKKWRRAKLNKVELKRHANLRKRSIRVHPRVVDEIEDVASWRSLETLQSFLTGTWPSDRCSQSSISCSLVRVPIFDEGRCNLSKDTRIHSFAYRRIFVGNYGGFED